MKQLRINPSPDPCTRTYGNLLTCREVHGVAVWVDRCYRSEDEMWTEAGIQPLQGYVTLIVAQHHLAGGGPQAWTCCKSYRTYKNESFQVLSCSWLLGKDRHRLKCIHSYWGRHFLYKCLKVSRVQNLRQDMVRFLVVSSVSPDISGRIPKIIRWWWYSITNPGLLFPNLPVILSYIIWDTVSVVK
jgi:hypothetical protein